MTDRPLVLVADDDEDILMLVQATLSATYEIAVARNGEQALALLRELRPAAAVLDIAMPLMDGLEVLTRLRGDADLSSLPVVLLSARAQEQDVAHGYELGASKYIRKPFSPRDLVAAIDELLTPQEGV